MIADADKEDVIWLAGLLEGEGAFDLQRHRYPRVRLAMTDRDVVGRAATLFGSSIRLRLRGKPATSTWHSEVQGPRAAAIMRAVLPYMGARRSGKIAEILAREAELRGVLPVGATRAAGLPLTRPPGLISPALKGLQIAA